MQAVIFWAHGKVPRSVLQRVGANSLVYVSIISPWEFLLKQNGQSFGMDYDQLLQTIRLLQANFLPVKEAHLNLLHSMPVIAQHNDPFDRLLIAQALQEDFILVGNDKRFLAYQQAFSLQLLWEA